MSKPTQMTEWHFFDKVYRRWLVVLIGPKAEFKQHLDKDGYKFMDDFDEYFASTLGAHIRLDETNNTIGNNCHIIWLPKMNVGTLIHELAHLVMSIFDVCGVDFGYDNQEAFTYYQEFWFNEITSTIKKHPRGLGHAKVLK